MDDIYISSLEVITRLIISAIVGGIIGFERESSNRPAGFRTHILVTIGSALIMMVSATAFDPIGQGNDPQRLAAQVVSGIGFLGAGTIMRNGSEVKGLTTAASLWVCAGLGLAFGAGLYVHGFAGGVIVISTLTVLNKLDKSSKKEYIVKKLQDERAKLDKTNIEKMVVIRDLSKGTIGDIEAILMEYDTSIYETKISKTTPIDSKDNVFSELEIVILDDIDSETIDEITEKIKNLPGISKINWS